MKNENGGNSPSDTIVLVAGVENLQREVMAALKSAGLKFTVCRQDGDDVPAMDRPVTALAVHADQAAESPRTSIELKFVQAAIESLEQGLVAFDRDLKILFSNSSFVKIADYPDWLGRPGASITDGLRYDAERGVYGPGEVAEKIAELTSAESMREPFVFERTLDDGRTIEIRRSPMPDGGLVALHTDITERKRIEDALKESEERLNLSLDAATIGTWSWNLLDGSHFWDSRMLLMSGMPHDALTGIMADDFIRSLHPDDKAMVMEAIRRSLEEGADYNVEYRLVRRDNGEVRDINARASVIRDETGTPIRMTGVAIDITEQKTARRMLADSEARLRAILDTSPVGVGISDIEDGTVKYVNDRNLEISGLTREQILGRSAKDYWADLGDRDSFVEAFRRDGRVSREVQLKKADGTVFWCVLSWEHSPAAENEVIFWVHDISELKQAQDDSKRSQEELTRHRDHLAELVEERTSELVTITDNLPVLIARLDREERYLFVNATAEHWYQRTAGQILGKTTKEILGEAVHKELAPLLEQVLAGRPVSAARRTAYPDGVTRDVEVTGVPDVNAEGAVKGVFILAVDISERHALEERLRQAQKMEALGQLTGGIAHDFNNLLTVILGNAELLAGETTRGEKIQRAIVRAAERGAELTRNLLAFSRTQPLSPQIIDLAELTEGMSEMLRRSLGATVEITTSSEVGLWPAVADPGQVENALLNLALNARDAMPDGGTLHIGARNISIDDTAAADYPEDLKGDFVILVVADTGAGMDALTQERAFEPFYTTKEVGEGSGLGLSMVYGFAKQSGGHVELTSAPGAGTTVRLYLPRAAHAVREVLPGADSDLALGRGERVLVIEDDEDVRILAVTMLETLGYRVIEAADAAAARRILAEGDSVDLVLSDVVLPGGASGPEFAREIRRRDPGLRIIFMSGYQAETAGGDGLLGSSSVLLNKPFHLRQLATAVREALA